MKPIEFKDYMEKYKKGSSKMDKPMLATPDDKEKWTPTLVPVGVPAGALPLKTFPMHSRAEIDNAEVLLAQKFGAVWMEVVRKYLLGFMSDIFNGHLPPEVATEILSLLSQIETEGLKETMNKPPLVGGTLRRLESVKAEYYDKQRSGSMEPWK